jgi:hypothetical protein
VHHPDSSLVMAEQSVHDVVNQTMSEGEHLPSDANEANPIRYSVREDTAALEPRADIQKEDRSGQDGQEFESDPVNLPMLNGQAHVCRAVLSPSFMSPNSVS